MRRRIEALIGDRGHVLKAPWMPYRGHMFGPLNGVRVALVITAVVAALAAVLLGEYLVAAVFAAAIALHGLGWWFLWREHDKSH